MQTHPDKSLHDLNFEDNIVPLDFDMGCTHEH